MLLSRQEVIKNPKITMLVIGEIVLSFIIKFAMCNILCEIN